MWGYKVYGNGLGFYVRYPIFTVGCKDGNKGIGQFWWLTLSDDSLLGRNYQEHELVCDYIMFLSKIAF